jgi:tyrosyl-tRNA synthetase
VAAATLPTHVATLPANVVDLLAEAKLVASKGEARRLIAQNGVRLNDTPVGDVAAQVTAADLRDGAAKLSLGKKKHLLVRAG